MTTDNHDVYVFYECCSGQWPGPHDPDCRNSEEENPDDEASLEVPNHPQPATDTRDDNSTLITNNGESRIQTTPDPSAAEKGEIDENNINEY